MAITFRSGATATGVASCIITAPSGLSSGDVMVACVVIDAGTPSGPAGWYRVALGNTVAGNPVSAWMKVAGGSEPGNYTFSGGSTLTEGVILAFVGVDNTVPNDADTTVSNGNAATVAWPDIKTRTAGAWHVALVGDTTGGVGTPTNYSARTSSVIYVDTFTREIAAAGNVTGVTATGGVDWATVSVALRPFVANPSASVFYLKS